MRKMNFIFFVALLFFLISCERKPQKNQQSKEPKDSLVEKSIKDSALTLSSKSHSVSLRRFYIRHNNNLKYYGFKDQIGNTVIPPRFKYAERFKNNIAKVYDGNKWGLIDKKGKYIVKPQYKYISYLENNFSLINLDGYWGYLDHNFKQKIAPKFLAASPFKKGKAMVLVTKDSLAMIDTLGNIVEKFCQYPDTNNNEFKNLNSSQINEILKPSESFGNLRDYIKNHLEINSNDFYFLKKAPSDGEGSSYLGFQNLEYGIIFFGSYWYESMRLHLRLPGISFEDGVNLAVQIVGYHLKSLSYKGKKFKLDMSYELEHYILVEESEKGFVQLIEVTSS